MPIAAAIALHVAFGAEAKLLGERWRQQVHAARVEDELIRAFAVHLHIRIDVIVIKVEREGGFLRAIRDGVVVEHDLWRGISRCGLRGQECDTGGRHVLIVLRIAIAGVDLVRDLNTVLRAVVGQRGGEGLRALHLDNARE